jgi:hypothetical protein
MPRRRPCVQGSPSRCGNLIATMCPFNLTATTMSDTVYPQVLYKAQHFSLQTGLERCINELKEFEDSEIFDIEEELELAEDGTDHWACSESESEVSESEVSALKKRKQQC